MMDFFTELGDDANQILGDGFQSTKLIVVVRNNKKNYHNTIFLNEIYIRIPLKQFLFICRFAKSCEGENDTNVLRLYQLSMIMFNFVLCAVYSADDCHYLRSFR